MRALTHTVTVLTVLMLTASAFASDQPTEVMGSFAWHDSTETLERSAAASFDLVFPVAPFLSIGPVFSYSYLRPPETEVVVVEAPPVEELSSHETTPAHDSEESPDPGVTASDPFGNSVSIWSFGGRAQVYTSKSHNGIYFAVEAIIPQADAEGYLLTPEAGYQRSFGDGNGADGLLRIAYKRPYHQQAGELIELGSQQITVGFGISF